MKRLSLILSLIFLISLSSLSCAGVNFGMTGAIKEKVKKLDENENKNVNTNPNDGGKSKKWVLQKVTSTDGGQTLYTGNYFYDSNGNQISGNMSSSSFNINFTNTFNSNGQMTRKIQNNLTWKTTSTTDYTYDTNGDAIRLVTTNTGGGTTYTQITDIRYDSHHNIIKSETFINGVSSGIQTSIYVYAADEKKIINVKDYVNGTYYSNTDNTYDSNGRVITKTITMFLGGTQSTIITTFTYDSNGNLATTKSTGSTAVTTYTWIEI